MSTAPKTTSPRTTIARSRTIDEQKTSNVSSIRSHPRTDGQKVALSEYVAVTAGPHAVSSDNPPVSTEKTAPVRAPSGLSTAPVWRARYLVEDNSVVGLPALSSSQKVNQSSAMTAGMATIAKKALA